MSLRLEMLQVARLAPTVLGEEAAELVIAFVRSGLREDGGFAGRDGKSDLYYTSFAIDALTALQVALPEDQLGSFLRGKLREWGDLDFVHLCCLARCFSALQNEKAPADELAPVWDGIESYRTADGGYNQARGSSGASAYACFLAFGAYGDHGLQIPKEEGVRAAIESLRKDEGAWANDALLPVANVPATAAAISLCRNLQIPVGEETGHWILKECFQPASGGIVPFPGAPLPDLLSTAVGLHALDGLQVGFQAQKESMLDFVDSLWTNQGGFHGSWEDDELDIEYTYYGLLALGHLAI